MKNLNSFQHFLPEVHDFDVMNFVATEECREVGITTFHDNIKQVTPGVEFTERSISYTFISTIQFHFTFADVISEFYKENLHLHFLCTTYHSKPNIALSVVTSSLNRNKIPLLTSL